MHDQQPLLFPSPPHFGILLGQALAPMNSSKRVSDQTKFDVVGCAVCTTYLRCVHCSLCSLGQSGIVHDQLLDASLQAFTANKAPKSYTTSLATGNTQHTTSICNLCQYKGIVVHRVHRQATLPAHNYLLRAPLLPACPSLNFCKHEIITNGKTIATILSISKPNNRFHLCLSFPSVALGRISRQGFSVMSIQ